MLLYDNSSKAFEIGSITKVFTSTILASLVLDETIKLDEPIKSFLKTRKKDIKKITFKQLSNHTSGFPRLPSNLMSSTVNISNPYQHYKEQNLLEYLNDPIKLSNEPGKAFEYSNTGAGLLAYLLSKASSKDYHQLLDEIVFSKYNMSISTYDRTDLQAELVDGLGSLGDKVPNWDFAAMEGAGGIISTTNELSKFALAQFDTSNLELSLTRTKTFDIDPRRSVGLGWLIIKEDTDEQRFWHNGGTGGYSSSMILEVKSKNAVIILSNVSPYNQYSNKIDALCFGLIDLI
jgi:CubicO group peptidase (beta-lactamase class C family)